MLTHIEKLSKKYDKSVDEIRSLLDKAKQSAESAGEKDNDVYIAAVLKKMLSENSFRSFVFNI